MKTVIDTLEDVVEPLREHYEAKNGKFHLKIEDLPSGFVKSEDLLASNTKLVEFRDNNIRLMKEAETLNSLKLKFEGIDVDAAKDALARVKALGSKGIKDADDLDARLKAMVDDAVKPLREQVATSAAETATERARANEFLLHSKIGDVFAKNGGKPNATDYIVSLAKDNFEVKDRAIVAKIGKFSTEKPGEPLTIEEWLTGTVHKEHDYVFEPSGGGGAPPKSGSNTPVRPKAGQTLLTNPTAQELGANAAAIRAGTVKVNFEDTAQH